ncbi:MAG: FKBP-type peptidyl-prolyl cis-trans isomerase [Saprospiraceae bacterium]|nr:FKBP-type peptidyl-prolyl cis-trans isomerase [Saprospiraceae bacterium]
MNKQLFGLFLLISIMGSWSCKKTDTILSATEEDALIKAFIAKKSWTAKATPEGIYYVTDSIGTGTEAPTDTNYVSIKYKSYVLNVDTPYDTSRTTTPVEFRLGSVIEGLRIGLKNYKTGSKGKIIIPSAYAFGESTDRGVPAYSILVFEFEMLSIKTQAVAEDDQIKAYIAKKGWTAQATPEGVYYVIDSVGTGTATPTLTSIIKCFYKGYFLNESVFDSNLAPKAPIEFNLSGLIEGWQIGFQKFKEGGKGKILMPSRYGYGSQGSGSIAPNTILVFDVELVSFR